MSYYKGKEEVLSGVSQNSSARSSKDMHLSCRGHLSKQVKTIISKLNSKEFYNIY